MVEAAAEAMSALASTRGNSLDGRKMTSLSLLHVLCISRAGLGGLDGPSRGESPGLGRWSERSGSGKRGRFNQDFIAKVQLSQLTPCGNTEGPLGGGQPEKKETYKSTAEGSSFLSGEE